MKRYDKSQQTRKTYEMNKSGFGSLALGALALIIALLLGGCGSGGSGSGTTPMETSEIEAGSSDSGTVIIGLTDADGDFLAYSVDVLSLTLTKANGTVVETLPLTTRIDFAQYTEMTEFVTAATIPSGIYTHAKMQLDYSNADIQVEVDGIATPAEVQDSDGNEITILDVTVKLSERNALVIAPGIPAHLTLDFDLKASNEADITTDPPLVTVEPFMIAEVNPERPKIHRVRGPLKAVDLEGDSFQLIIRPFHHPNGGCGDFTVLVDDETIYEIDGENLTGKSGLEILGEKPFGTAVIAIGNLNMTTYQFEANEVYAGSSVPGGELDVVTGNVIAREGDELTLQGATLVRQDGTMIFHDNVTVFIGSETRITRPGIPGEGLNKDDISVGQRVTAFGTLLEDQPGSLELDAANGLVRMLMTILEGEVVSVEEGLLVLDLETIDRRRISIFDFTGTGIDSNNDADPEDYEISTGTLDLLPHSPAGFVKVRGYVRAFGQAPEDFEAQTVILP